MAQRIKLLVLAATAALTLGATGVSSVANAHAASNESAANNGSADQPAYEQVDSFVIWRRPYSWQPVDDKTVIVWSTPFDAYLVELAFPSHDMRFVEAIGVSSSGSRVYAKFDAVTIRGFRYPIDNIYKLSREEARNLTERHKSGNS
jgi:hypothetical protein